MPLKFNEYLPRCKVILVLESAFIEYGNFIKVLHLFKLNKYWSGMQKGMVLICEKHYI